MQDALDDDAFTYSVKAGFMTFRVQRFCGLVRGLQEVEGHRASMTLDA